MTLKQIFFFFFKENTILTGSWCCEESLQLWDISTRKLLYTVPMQIRATKYDGQFLYTAQFLKPGLGWRSSDPQLVAVGGSGFNQVAIVKVSDGKVRTKKFAIKMSARW